MHPHIRSQRSSFAAEKKPPKEEHFDPAEFKRIMELGKTRGLIRDTTCPTKIEKNGEDLATQGTLRSQWIHVGPDLAEKWLANNVRNRSIKEDTVAAYARDMLNGTWISTHQGLAFNDRDELIDGQHRLHAIILSGKTVRMMVTFGLPSVIEGKEMTTMDAVDRGRTRSVADQLKIQHGFKHGSVIASICASLAGICSQERTRRLSVGETLDIYRAFEHPVNWIIANRPKEHGLKQAGVLAGFAFAMATENGITDGTTAIGKLFEDLVGGEELPAKSAMKALHVFLTSDEAKLLTRRTDRGLAELVLQAIYLETKIGKPVKELLMSPDGVSHFRSLNKKRVEFVGSMFRLPKTTKGNAS